MYLRNSKKWYKHLDFILLDLLSLFTAYVMAFRLKNGNYSFLQYGIYRRPLYILLVLDLLCIFLFETLRNILKRNSREEFIKTLFHAICVFTAFLGWIIVFKPQLNFSREYFIYHLIFHTILSFLLRELRKGQLRAENNIPGLYTRRILIAAPKYSIVNTIREFKKNNYRGYEIAGGCVVDNDSDYRNIDGVPMLKKEDLIDFATKNWIDEIYFDPGNNISAYNALLSSFCNMGITTHVVLQPLQAFVGSKQFVEKIGGKYTITAAIATLNNLQATEKRIMDIIGGLVGCAITLVLTVIIGPIIFFSDPGPIFYSSVRVGRNGKKFKMYKFRSMYMDADERKAELMKQNKVKDGMMFKMDDDPRIIGSEKKDKNGKPKGIGNFIRNTSLDEFPQFLNVLLGQMSLVGTRPPTPDEYAKYEPHHRARLSTKPGITGNWQVSGRSDITDFEQVVHLDKEYISTWSIWGDIKIILKTIKVVLKKEGSC